jgi:ribosome-binding factor A
MRREEEGAGHRHARLEGLVFEELRALLRDDVADPTLASVRILATTLSVDYRHARVHFALRRVAGTSNDDRKGVERALVRVTPFLRARLSDALDLKRVPDLRFVFDAVALDTDEEASWSE